MAYFECSKYDREHYILDVRDRIDAKVVKNLMRLYGVGQDRVKNLGDHYEAVQDKTNQICRSLNHRDYVI